MTAGPAICYECKQLIFWGEEYQEVESGFFRHRFHQPGQWLPGVAPTPSASS